MKTHLQNLGAMLLGCAFLSAPVVLYAFGLIKG
jgi:hypothetical protein